MTLEYIVLIEIQAEILKRLPLKPLLQFRLVSKPWKRLIDGPNFIAFYGVHQPQPHRLILRYECEVINEHKYYSFVDEPRRWYEDNNFIEGWGEETIPVPDLVAGRECYPFVVGSSHGLLCFKKLMDRFSDDCDSTEMVVLWNPSIRKYVCIPVPDYPNYKFDYHDGNDDFGNYGNDDAIGFGVCPVTYDPTILKVKRIDHNRETNVVPGISLPWRVRFFTLSTGTWSILSTNLPRESMRLRGSQVAIDGFIYWIAFDMLDVEDGRSQSEFLIMSFDLTAKEFIEITLTSGLTNCLCSIQTISSLRESLVLLEYHREFEADVPMCCLWMMKKQGVNRSFTKLYNINVPHATVKTLLGFRNTGELILVTKQQEQYNADLEIYDPKSEAIVDLDQYERRHDGYDYSFFMCSYMESLLLLDQLDGFIYSISI